MALKKAMSKAGFLLVWEMFFKNMYQFVQCTLKYTFTLHLSWWITCRVSKNVGEKEHSQLIREMLIECFLQVTGLQTRPHHRPLRLLFHHQALDRRWVVTYNNFAHASRFLVLFFTVTAPRIRRGKCHISRFIEDVNKRRRIFLSLSKLECGPQEINSREIHLHLTFLANWNKFEKVLKKVNSF